MAEIVSGDYCRLEVDGFPGIVCFNDKQIGQGKPVTLSLRPEKLRISRERPEADRLPQRRARPRRGRDLPRHPHEVLGERAGVPDRGARAAQPLPAGRDAIRWKQDVWISWHADDGFMLERYSESDEKLTGQPPERVGEGS